MVIFQVIHSKGCQTDSLVFSSGWGVGQCHRILLIIRTCIDLVAVDGYGYSYASSSRRVANLVMCPDTVPIACLSSV